jgi:anti-sigma factor RsiW
MNNFSPHLSFTELTDVADELSQPAAETLEHLATCSHCAKELQSLRQAIGLMRIDDVENAPASLIKNAKDMFRVRGANRVPSRLARVLAALTFDSLTAKPAFGLRSGASAGRQLVYSTEMADIDLRVSPQSGEWEIAGQILGSSQSGGKVNLESDSFSASADLNELAEFGFQSVPSGIYTMFVHLPELEIEIPPLQLGH